MVRRCVALLLGLVCWFQVSGQAYAATTCTTSPLPVVNVPGGSLGADLHLAGGTVYTVATSLTVPSGVTLTIDPGAIVKFAFGQGLVVNGTLNAQGSVAQPICFTSFRDDQIGGNTGGSNPQAGDWPNLEFGATSHATISNALLRYSGYGGHSVFQALAYTVPTIGSNVTLSNNIANGIELPGGQPAADTELPAYPVPYLVSGSITVPAGVTLTVDPGAIMKFGFGQGLFVNGHLSAVGTAGAQTYFTSFRDDQVGGNTDGGNPQVGDWQGLKFGAGSTTTLNFATLRYSGYGGHSVLQSLAYTVPNVGSNVTLTNNVANGIELPGGQPAANTTFHSYPAAPYLVSGSITVPSGVTLTIDPGAVLKFGFGQGLFITGTLNAQGTSGQPIFFTSFRDDQIDGNTDGSNPQVGDWQGLKFAAGSSSTISNATLRYSGYGGHSVFQALAYTVPTIGSNVTLSNNIANGIELPGGQPSSNTELPNYPVPYLVSGTITVPSGVTLTVDPGAIVKFAFGQGLVVTGTLNAQGTSSQPIYLTSFRDDQLGGNTDGTGPQVNDWAGIGATQNGSVSLTYAAARYAGYGGNGALFVNGGTLTASNTCLTHNGVGVLGRTTGATITNSWIFGNTQGAVNQVAGPLSATGDWWGAPSGPTNTTLNPNGTGDSISSGVTFLPFVVASGLSCFSTPWPLPPPPPVFIPLSPPARIIDTRTTGGGPIPTGTSRCFTVAGQGGVPADAAAVVLNVTAVGYGTNGWLTAYPAGQSVPATSTLNFDVHEYAMANGAIMRLGSSGQVCVNVGTVNSAPGSSQVVLDATGYLTSAALSELSMLDSPQRLIDTRGTGGQIGTGASRCFVVAGQAGIPSDASAVVLNMTAAGYGTNGWLTAYPAGQSVPATSTLNFDVHEYATANGAIVRLGTGGQVCVNVGTVSNAPGASQVILDVTGFLTATGQSQVPMLATPQRLVDTRAAGGGGPIAGGTSRCFTLTNLQGIPSTATVILLNVAAVGYGTQGWLTVYPAGPGGVSPTSTLNFDTTEYAMANSTAMPIGTGGQVCVNVGTVNGIPGSSQVIIDAVGYQ